MDTHYSDELRYKPLLKLIFEHCNNDDTCKYKIYQSEDNIDYISMKLSCISKFITRLIKIVKSNLDEDKQIIQIQRFKDHTREPIFDKDTSVKLLKLMKLFINPEQIRRQKKHAHHMNHNNVYKQLMTKILNKPVYFHNFQDSENHQQVHHNVSMEDRDGLIHHLYDSLNKDQLQELKMTLSDLNNATSYMQSGGSDTSKGISFDEVSEINKAFFKELFMRISTKIQEDKVYGTLDSIVDYKKRLETFVRESIQDMDVPDHLRYFVDNVGNLVEAIYPSNIQNFIRSDDSLTAKIKNEFAEPFDLVELLLFALSVIPLPIINLIPDFMLIVHNLHKKKRVMFTILSSIALLIKMCTFLFFDLGPILKMFYLSKKIKNFNMKDVAKVMDKSVNDILTLPGGITKFGTGLISKAMVPLASAGQLRPENMSLQIGNNDPVSGSNPMAALSQLGKSAMGSMGSLKDTLGKLKSKKEEKDNEKNTKNTKNLEVEMAMTRGKIKHKEEALKKYDTSTEYAEVWKRAAPGGLSDPDRKNRLGPEIRDENNKLDALQKKYDSLTENLQTGGQLMVGGGEGNKQAEKKIKELEIKKNKLQREVDIRICKGMDSDQANAFEFTKKEVDCAGKEKRQAKSSDKNADNIIMAEYYKKQNELDKITFQIEELKKIGKEEGKGGPKAEEGKGGPKAEEGKGGPKAEEGKKKEKPDGDDK